MPKRGTMKIGDKYVSLGDMPSQYAGVSVGDMIKVQHMVGGSLHNYDALDDARLKYWKALPLEEVKWGARYHKVRIESKHDMVLKLALVKHLPEDPSTAPVPSTLVELRETVKDCTGKVISEKVISPKGQPIATEKKSNKKKRMRPY